MSLNKTVKYTAYINANLLNIRTGPGVEYKPVSFSPLKNGTAIGVCDTTQAKTGVTWLYIVYNNKYGFCNSKFISKNKGKATISAKPSTPQNTTTTQKTEALKEPPTIKQKNQNYQQLCLRSEKAVYDDIVKYKCRHKGGAYTHEDIIKKRITTCTGAVTAALVEAGLIKKGKRINHKPGIGGGAENILKKKNTIAKSMTGYENLDKTKCDVYYVGAKNWAHMPSRYKVPGAAYIQDSNGFMYQGKKNGKDVNRSCNNSGAQVKADSKGVKRYYNNTMIESGYTFKSPILVAIIPKKK